MLAVRWVTEITWWGRTANQHNLARAQLKASKLNLPRKRKLPSFSRAEGVSPSFCLTLESPFRCAPGKALLSLPGRLTLLLPWGGTRGLLSRSVWVAGVFPACFLFLATIAVGGSGGQRKRWTAEEPAGCEPNSSTASRIWVSYLHLY